MAELDIFIPQTLEDQLYLLNLLRYSVAKKGGKNESIPSVLSTESQLSGLFLHYEELLDIQRGNTEKFFAMQPETADQLDLSVTVRTICNGCSLLSQVCSPIEWSRALANSCKTSKEVDEHIGTCLTFGWTRKSLFQLKQSIGKVFDFLVVFGSLHVLPDGVLSPQHSCYKCRREDVLSGLNEICHTSSKTATLATYCRHILERRVVAENEERQETPHGEGNATQQKRLFPKPEDRVSERELEELSLGKRIARNRKTQEMKKVKNVLVKIQQNYKESCKKYADMAEDKCISTTLFHTVGRMMLFLKRRESCEQRFRHLMCRDIKDALQKTCTFCNSIEEKMEKFMRCLKSVTVEKIIMKIAQERFFQLFMDPITPIELSNSMIRSSILGKRFLLTFGILPEHIAISTHRWNNIKAADIVGAKCEETDERFFRAVVITYIYNNWLHVLDIPSAFHLGLHRGDVEVIPSGVYFTYEDEMLGLLLPNGTEVSFNYEMIIDLCFFHLSYLRDVLPPKHQLEIDAVL